MTTDQLTNLLLNAMSHGDAKVDGTARIRADTGGARFTLSLFQEPLTGWDAAKVFSSDAQIFCLIQR